MQSDDWHYVKGEQQLGPVPFQVLQTLARSGDLAAEDLVWSEGMDDWVEAETVQGLMRPAFQPRSRPGRGGRRRTSSRPTSRRPSRALGGAPSAPAPQPGPKREAPGGIAEDHEARKERLQRRRTSSTPIGIIVAAVCDFLITLLSIGGGALFLAVGTELRDAANEGGQSQSDIDILWEAARISDVTATVSFVVAGVFCALAILLLSRQTWGPIAQTVCSVICAGLGLWHLLGLDAMGAAAAPRIISGITLLLYIAPLAGVWSRASQEWLSANSGGGRGGRGRAGAGGGRRGR